MEGTINGDLSVFAYDSKIQGQVSRAVGCFFAVGGLPDVAKSHSDRSKFSPWTAPLAGQRLSLAERFRLIRVGD